MSALKMPTANTVPTIAAAIAAVARVISRLPWHPFYVRRASDTEHRMSMAKADADFSS